MKLKTERILQKSKATDKSNEQKNKFVLYVRMDRVISLRTALWEVWVRRRLAGAMRWGTWASAPGMSKTVGWTGSGCGGRRWALTPGLVESELFSVSYARGQPMNTSCRIPWCRRSEGMGKTCWCMQPAASSCSQTVSHGSSCMSTSTLFRRLTCVFFPLHLYNFKASSASC